MMNRERLEKILPKKIDREFKALYSDNESYVRHGYNQAREDCLSALLANGVGVIPSVEEIGKKLDELYPYTQMRKNIVNATAIRTLMQNGNV